MINFINHFIGIQRIIQNKILLNTIYLICLIFIFVLIFLFIIFLNKKYFPFLIDSIYLEIFIWIFPSLIIFLISIFSIKSSLYLNPLNYIYKNIKPLIVEIVSMNWKWMIILPKQKILVFNEICLPLNKPIRLCLISNAVINSFCIPKIGSQIYCMTNYKKNIYFFLLKHGLMHGLNANFSGLGSSYMRIKIFSVIKKTFYFWVKKIKKNKVFFNFKNYNFLSKQSFFKYDKFFNIRNNKIFFLIFKLKKK